MGFLNIFKSLFKTSNNSKTFLEEELSSCLEEASSPSLDREISQNDLLFSQVHPDLKNLLWFGDGPYKNYVSSHDETEQIYINIFTINYSTYGTEEPSLITTLPVTVPLNVETVPRPPYFPSYKELTPEQRWLYWEFLKNPYSGTHDIGYVFIFYYGIERYLFSKKSRKAFEVTLKLRDCYSNQSFQSYSGTALMLYSMVEKDVSLAESFLSSLDKQYEMAVPGSLLILLKYTLSLPLTAFELMRYSTVFEFKNQRYIKNNSDMFLGFLQQEIKKLYNEDFIPLAEVLKNLDSQHIPAIDIPLFANISIRDKVVRIPDFTKYAPFVNEMNQILVNAHEDVKKHLAQIRKLEKKPSPSDDSHESEIKFIHNSETVTIMPCHKWNFDTESFRRFFYEGKTDGYNINMSSCIPDSIKNYFYLSEQIMKEKDISKKITYCNHQLLLLPFFIKSELEISDSLPPVIACRDWGPKLYMRLGRWDDAESFIRNCIQSNAYFPKDGHEELLLLSRFRKVTDIVLNFLITNPGFLQKNMYKTLSLSEDDNEILKRILRHSLLIEKIPYKSTNKLYVKQLTIIEDTSQNHSLNL